MPQSDVRGINSHMRNRISAKAIAKHADVAERTLRRYSRGLAVRPSVRRRILAALEQLGLSDPRELAAALGGGDQ